ncbi:hypothetical protein MOV66_02500 [Agrobacterium sp. SHOUNA12C]|nr:hypothetical protein [Agrobacterium sp. BETTINA12B]MCJ9755503.1 hypothetical protein [Agrobacterium sp. SHOUNA12C]NTG34789.1 hypothetical protein [Rhizobium rhizogenes]NTG54038.1 hypothetical protein [Rhizobium rhizogenes]
MSSKFLSRGAIIDTIKSAERMNALQKRNGSNRYHVDAISCGCPDPNCGAFHRLRLERLLPTAEEAEATLRIHSKTHKRL